MNEVKYTSKHIEVRAQLNDEGTAYVIHFNGDDESTLTIPKDVFERLFRETGHEASDAVNESLNIGRPNLKTPKPKARAAK